jgi:hypothetical protein
MGIPEIVVLVGLVIGLIAWWCRPVTWQDGEGSSVDEDSDNRWRSGLL